MRCTNWAATRTGAHQLGAPLRGFDAGIRPARWKSAGTAGKDLGVELDTAADQLYVVFPSDFVRRRNELAAEAQRSGDKATAAAIKQLRKPTLGAWLANLLVHERNHKIDELLHLGDTLRDAQRNPTGAEMRRLAQQRHEFIATLVSEALDLVRKAGRPVADDAARELETTLSAVLADEGAAARFRSGRLTSTLEYFGFGPLEQVPGRVSPEGEHNPAKESGNDPLPGIEGRLRRRREVAAQALRDAHTAASDAIQALKDQEEELARLERQRDERRAEVSALEQQLYKTKAAASASEDDVRQSQKARLEIEGALRKAQDRITRAEKDIGTLPNP